MNPARDLDVIVPNFKRRLSGVTATVVRLVPIQAGMIRIAAVAPSLPPEVPQIPVRSLLTMPRRGPSGWRVWHARRNVEMIAGLVLRHVLRKRLRLLFTSASQRHHTALTRWLIGRMDAVVSTSEKTAAYLERPSQVIYHGIDNDSFSPAPDRAALRDRLGLPRDGIILGCFGRIRAQKGTDLFVESAIDLCARFDTVHAVVLGRATEKDQAFLAGLRARVRAAGLQDRIVFPGEVPVWDMPDWYRALDIYVAPQRWEGFGLTPLEAMACGVPVVATDVGAFRELIEEGETGHVVPPGSAPAITAAVAGLVADPARRSALARAARQHTLTHFDIRAEAQALVDIYRRLIGPATAP
ncbi:glycosyltransferase family 4 protein [Pontitalea aquivivens]|uniref:glycosyltransferase family 4 protein n=1 Tax=Pontitalea aquivivens TaxID=3388663 RepID=UPI00397072AB